MDLVTEELIRTLKRNTPQRGNTVDLLMSIIPVGKEAAYRRLRGEIPFTLDEAVVICKKLNISLDLLIGIKYDNNYSFHLGTMFNDQPLAEYCRMLNEVVEGVDFIKKDPKSYLYRACKTLPQDLLSKSKLLSKIYIYILLYQLQPDAIPKEIFQVDVPDNVFSMQRKSGLVVHELDSTLILDKHIFSDFIDIITYFYKLDMLTFKEVSQIREDLHAILDEIEACAISGNSFSGKKMDIYISHVTFDCTYTYMSGYGYEASAIGLYCIDFLSCDNPVVCNNHKQWIKSLLRFCTLISVSGELQRNEFFYKQREIVDTLSSI